MKALSLIFLLTEVNVVKLESIPDSSSNLVLPQSSETLNKDINGTAKQILPKDARSQMNLNSAGLQAVLRTVEKIKNASLSGPVMKVAKSRKIGGRAITRNRRLIPSGVTLSHQNKKGHGALELSGEGSKKIKPDGRIISSKNEHLEVNHSANSSLDGVGNTIQDTVNSTSNSTDNSSSVPAPASGGQIEVVILQPRESLRTKRPHVQEPALGRRFPSAILAPPNITLIHNNLFQSTYPSRSYWPIYLTLTLMCFCSLGVCLICCSSESRRHMAGPPREPPKPQHQELPPYPYGFSYDTRAAENQPLQVPSY